MPPPTGPATLDAGPDSIAAAPDASAHTRGVGPTSRLLVVAGSGSVVLGGLVAAVTPSLRLEDGSWLAAYLVLVCGVASHAMGRAPAMAWPGPSPVTRAWAWIHVGCWAVGNAAVVTGTLTAVPGLVDAGSVLLVLALVVAVADTMRSTRPARGAVERVVGWSHRTLLLVLMTSVPVGAVLAHVRHAG